LSPLFAAGFFDTGGKFATGINNTSKTGGKICKYKTYKYKKTTKAEMCLSIYSHVHFTLYRVLVHPTEYTKLQPLLSGVHSVMRVKSVLHAHPLSLYLPSPVKLHCYAPAEWADTLTLFHFYQYMYSVVHPDK
jgi:hypothetical protein